MRMACEARPQLAGNGMAVGITAVFIGYLSVWLPGPAAGLQFIGVEMGEWIKFLGVGPIRNLFYLPPITVGAAMALLSATWRNGRWQTWAWRATAVFISLLAFPALEDVTGQFRSEYTPRVWLIGGVVLLVLLASVLSQRQLAARGRSVIYLLTAVVAIVGAFLPTWLYTAVLPIVEQVIGQSLGMGFGVWLTALGHAIIGVVALWQLKRLQL